MKTYAIGDVYGRADLLAATLTFIENDNRGAPSGYRVIFLGDIIDRGPNSKAAMDLVVAELQRRSASRLILGNHEEFLLLFLARPDKRHVVFDHWMSNGGLAAAASYGLDLKRPYSRIDDAHNALLGLLQSHPGHIAALRNASSHFVANEYIFVHAGLRPGVPMADQTEKDMRTIRSDFLNCPYDFGRKVVHGHTETRSGRPEVYGNRIALDTAASATDVLSTLAMETTKDNRFFATRSGRTGIEVSLVNPAVFLTLDDVEHDVAKRRRA
ncbi:serine/threonine protein phosphatase [Rhizobium ruizarguesonis]|uniref:metallophosphoesterase n=1 Tax=Rhizobium ruizarguesonis TaxID=2081791 RepID=UPI00103168E6|nr:metallophosphoesterase [Rhizobium ruizarguesonis]TAZ94596.1 serine/threonine protein phosphatase [Rhizobium ruizarguesonis]